MSFGLKRTAPVTPLCNHTTTAVIQFQVAAVRTTWLLLGYVPRQRIAHTHTHTHSPGPPQTKSRLRRLSTLADLVTVCSALFAAMSWAYDGTSDTGAEVARFFALCDFYSALQAQYMLRQIRLSVCPSHFGIVSKRRNADG